MKFNITAIHKDGPWKNTGVSILVQEIKNEIEGISSLYPPGSEDLVVDLCRELGFHYTEIKIEEL